MFDACSFASLAVVPGLCLVVQWVLTFVQRGHHVRRCLDPRSRWLTLFGSVAMTRCRSDCVAACIIGELSVVDKLLRPWVGLPLNGPGLNY